MKAIKILAVLGLFSLLAACAGTDFVRPADSTYSLGSTTKQQILEKQGKPYRQGQVTKNNEALESFSYAYAATGGDALYSGVVSARSLGFYFSNNILVGKEFVSSFKSDASDFDESKMKAITKGVSTKEQVIALLGNPSGSYIYPLIKNKEDTAMVYQYTQAKGTAFNMKFYQKLLVISFNNNVVTDIEYTSSGEK